MNSDFTKLIDRYLSNELTPTEKQDFEKELNQNINLQKEVYFQKEIIEGIKRASTRSKIQKIGKSYHFQKGITTGGIVFVIILSVSLLSYLIYNSISSNTKDTKIENSPSLLEKLEAIAPIDNLASEFFDWKGNDSIVLSKSGVLLSIPENAFLLNGKPYKQGAIIQWQEAKDGPTIVKSGLSTMADNRLLETQGMFGFQAYTDKGEKLTVNPKVGVYVQTPVNEYKKDMQLFTGEKNKDGIINWTNPKPLEKIPVSVDMKDLDFYPQGYEKKLTELKKPTNKKYRDSLYLSFDEADNQKENVKSYIQEDNNELNPGEYLFKNKCAACHQAHRDGTGPKLFNVRQKWAKESKIKNLIYEWVNNWQNAATKSEYANSKTSYSAAAMQQFPELKREDIDLIFDYIDNQTAIHKVLSDSIPQHSFIPPSKVLAFWNPKFNHTLLATREFEKRMATIHSTCDEKLLNLYTSNLSETMKSLDEKAVKMGYKQFNSYVNENIGAVNPDNSHYKNLERFYKNAIEQLQQETFSNRKKQQEKDTQWDNDINKERSKEFQRRQNRESKALNEEYEFNLKNVAKQLGKTLGFQIHGGGTIYNIDKYVWDATVARTTTTIVDPETGKTAEIVYNPFSFQVENNENYPKLFAYLFPSRLNSYQRISPIKGKFDYPLNNDIDYDLCIVGISEKGYFYQEKKGVKKGDLGELNLEEISEKELDKKISNLNEARGILDKMPIGDELAWLYKEQKDYVVQKKRRENEEFRRTIRKVIFPCWVETHAYGAAAVTDSLAISNFPFGEK